MRSTGSRCRRAFGIRWRAASSLPAGIERNVDVYPSDTWHENMARIAELDSLSREAQEMKRYVFAGAAVAELDRQGRVLLPAPRRARRHREDVVVAGVHDHVEIWDRAAGQPI